MALQVEKVVTSGTFSLDGGTWDVDNNAWLIGDDTEVLVVDAAHLAQPILDAIGTRRVVAIACTHAHADHVTVAPELSEATQAPGSTPSRRRHAVERGSPRTFLQLARRR